MHLCGYVSMYVWHLELTREPSHVAQQMTYRNVGLQKGHWLGAIKIFSLKGLTQLRKSHRIYPEYMPKCSVGYTDYVCNFFPQKY